MANCRDNKYYHDSCCMHNSVKPKPILHVLPNDSSEMRTNTVHNSSKITTPACYPNKPQYKSQMKLSVGQIALYTQLLHKTIVNDLSSGSSSAQNKSDLYQNNSNKRMTRDSSIKSSNNYFVGHIHPDGSYAIKQGGQLKIIDPKIMKQDQTDSRLSDETLAKLSNYLLQGRHSTVQRFHLPKTEKLKNLSLKGNSIEEINTFCQIFPDRTYIPANLPSLMMCSSNRRESFRHFVTKGHQTHKPVAKIDKCFNTLKKFPWFLCKWNYCCQNTIDSVDYVIVSPLETNPRYVPTFYNEAMNPPNQPKISQPIVNKQPDTICAKCFKPWHAHIVETPSGYFTLFSDRAETLHGGTKNSR